MKNRAFVVSNSNDLRTLQRQECEIYANFDGFRSSGIELRSFTEFRSLFPFRSNYYPRLNRGPA